MGCNRAAGKQRWTKPRQAEDSMPRLPHSCPGSFPGLSLQAIGRASPWCITPSLPRCRQFAHKEQSGCGGAGLLPFPLHQPAAVAAPCPVPRAWRWWLSLLFAKEPDARKSSEPACPGKTGPSQGPGLAVGLGFEMRAEMPLHCCAWPSYVATDAWIRQRGCSAEPELVLAQQRASPSASQNL